MSRLLTFLLTFFCFIQLVSSTPFDRSAAAIAVSNKKADVTLVNAAQTSQNAVTSLLVAVIVATGGVLSSFL